jgi:hypothetical protein
MTCKKVSGKQREVEMQQNVAPDDPGRFRGIVFSILHRTTVM